MKKTNCIYFVYLMLSLLLNSCETDKRTFVINFYGEKYDLQNEFEKGDFRLCDTNNFMFFNLRNSLLDSEMLSIKEAYSELFELKKTDSITISYFYSYVIDDTPIDVYKIYKIGDVDVRYIRKEKQEIIYPLQGKHWIY